jgi:chromosome segregation protein
MYLKSIEVHGFKSFANKITLQFHDGITGIVGPNGSGKSNVADAVRWVLGEQSAKQLRGAKMEDVIFSGTQTRKPLGYAYVSLTMDNSDHKLPIEFEEVTVSRRVYRSGESEYLINGSPCRLKDVYELFLDTGIGKEGYSIIGQGQIDKILSSKPEDRRELFDEAAGIVKYKRRKNEAEKNLEEEKLNLSRVTDIIKEIEKQLSPLEKQSAVAKVYLKLKEELKGLEVGQFLLEYDRLRAAKEQLEDKINTASTDLDKSKADYENTKEEYQRLEQQLEDYDRIIDENKSSLNQLKLDTEKAEGEIKVLKEQISSILQNDEYIRNRQVVNLKEIEDKKAEEDELGNEKAVIDEKISKADDLLTESLSALKNIKDNIISYSKEIEDCNNSIFEHLNINSGIKTNMQRYDTMLEQSNIRKAELNQKIINNKSEACRFEEAIGSLQDNLQEISDILINQTKESSEFEKSINNTQAVIDNLSLEYNEIQARYLSEKSRLESLINLTERYEGYGNSIKKVMEQKSVMPGIIGVVADIIKVDKAYETAIETALGSSIQNIVTDDEATAKSLISYLKQNKFGRATFLPLTNMTAGHTYTDNKILKETGVIGVAAKLAEAAPQFTALTEYLLGRIIVVDDINHATTLARKYNYTLRIVTLEGELLTPGGSISGGAYKNASNLLGRRREIDEYEAIVSSLQTKAEDLLKQKEERKEIKSKLRQELENLKLQMQENFLKQNTAKMNLDRELARRAEAEAICQEFVKELQEIELQSVELKKNLSKLNESLSQNSLLNKEKEDQIEQLTKKLEQERLLEQTASDETNNLRMELSSLEQSSQFILENIRRIKKDLDRLFEEEASLKADNLKSLALVKEKEEAVKSTEETIQSYHEAIMELDQKIKEGTSQKEQINSIHKSFFSKREELSKLMNELDKECYRLNSQKEKLAEQCDILVNYMWEEYELTYSGASEYPVDKEISLSQAKKLISEIKANIKELGDVNVNAIEDYKNLLERYEFLINQKDDLIKSEEALLQIISELDTEMRIQFQERFQAINVQFDIVFKELFGGGKADLELTDSEDILEAGIRINAQPPGKKLQNMMQLSGGEKALTAISLLFAIQNLKPSPFCLLDEIEAALDDSNVKRFANYLHKLTKDTQFIIITHRRGTMAAADILYGITMQEKGVSTLVSVSLIENDLDK